MTIDWDIDPTATHRPLPRRPEPPARSRRNRPRIGRRRGLVAGGVTLLAVVGIAVGAATGGDPVPRHAPAGSRLGQQDPFGARRPRNLVHLWSSDFLADPTELLVDHADVFVVTPTAVTALGLDEGRRRWTADVKDAEPFVAADDHTVLVAAADGFEALERPTGRSRWRVAIDDPADIGRTVGLVETGRGETGIALTEHGGLVGLDGATGSVRWSVALDAAPRGRIAVDDASAAAAVLTTDGEHCTLRVFDAESGTVRWTAVLPRDTGVPVISGDLLMIGSGSDGQGTVTAFSVADGRRRWDVGVGDGFEATQGPAVSGRTAVFVNHLGTMTAIRIATGTVAWSTKLPSPVLADSPAIAGDVVVVHDTFARVHTVALATGRLLASRASIGVPLGIGAGPGRIVYAQAQVPYGQVMAYAPAVLASRVPRAGR